MLPDIRHFALAMLAVTLGILGSGEVWAASVLAAAQTGHQSATAPAKAKPDETRGTATPPEPAAHAEAHGTVAPRKPIAQGSISASGRTVTPKPVDAHGKATPGNPVAPSAHQAGVPPVETSHGSAPPKAANEPAGKAPAADPKVGAVEAVANITRLMAEQVARKSRPPAGKTSTALTHAAAPAPAEHAPPVNSPRPADHARPAGQSGRAEKVQRVPLLVWDTPAAGGGVALEWDADFVPRSAPSGRSLGVRLSWPR